MIYAPAENANPDKLEAMRWLGADVRQHGRDFDDAREQVERVAKEERLRYVHSANEPLLIAGVGTIGLEIIETAPDTAVIIVPVGGGSGAAGVCLAVKAYNSEIRVIGVQSKLAPAAWRAWKDRDLGVSAEMQTEQEGLATRVPFEMTQRMLWAQLDDFITVSDAEIRDAMRRLASDAKLMAEGAGAASLAAAWSLRDQLAGKTVVGVLSGGNLPLKRSVEVLVEGYPDSAVGWGHGGCRRIRLDPSQHRVFTSRN